uniref:ZP domain-containing protein n=1 Tax=Bursaphelenchus xylophilus TaxID=6326 RepID=A0A1I7SBT2_BURXY
MQNEFGRHIIMGNHIGVILRDTSVTIMARENFTLSHNFQLVEKQVFDFDIRVRFPACKTIISVPIGIFAAQESDNYRMLIVCLILTGVAIIAISFFVCMLMCCCNNQKPPVQVSESTEDPESVVTTSERSSKSSKKCSKTST